ncbi:MAG: DUF1573 domain-containing protein [Dysgonamonadaceae bacterium]|nr:DUF1573 domain-containing protein [Dysgonamonadaceae bacterium]
MDNNSKIDCVGKKVYFPSELKCFNQDKELSKSISDSLLYKTPYKILIYMDSTVCTDCKMKINGWQSLIDETKIIFGEQARFLFFIQPLNVNMVKAKLLMESFEYPVFIDKNFELDNNNQYLRQFDYQGFLLDNDNTILLAGNPVENDKVWESFKTVINGNKPVDGTTINLSDHHIDCGAVKSGETYEYVFSIKNTGQNDLLITRIQTTCSCTAHSVKSRRIMPDKETQIKLVYKASGVGNFTQKAFVSGNFPNSPLELVIQGSVVE